MLEDIRNHDASPTPEETDWIGTDAIALIVRSVGVAGVALAIGVAASMIVSPSSHAVPPMTAAVSR